MKYTDWFVNGEKPVRIGVYNISCRKYDQTGEWYVYWDGQGFCHDWTTDKNEAYQYYLASNGEHTLERHIGSWRGILKD